jgi:acetylornithine deacetylase
VTISINQEYLIETLVAIVRINSINPTLVPGAPGEAELGDYVAAAMRDLGLEVRLTELEPSRVNVVGKLAGRGNRFGPSGRSLLLNAHMDTVGVTGMTIDPFGAEIKDGRLYGRGSYDMKASLAAMLAAVKALQDGGVTLAGDLWLTAVADEEALSIGSAAVAQEITADGVIVTEPTHFDICRAHRGFIWYEVETVGRAAHGSRFQEGIDANMRMGRFLAELDKLEQDLRGREPHELAGPPSLHAALLHGGTELSTYAANCVLQLERRTIPGETEAGARRELQAIIDELARADETFQASVKPFFQRNPYSVAADAPIIQTLEEVVTAHFGQPPAHVGATFWTDAALFAEAGMDAVLLGPTGDGAHSAVEWVDLQSAVDLAQILAETAVRFCS